MMETDQDGRLLLNVGNHILTLCIDAEYRRTTNVHCMSYFGRALDDCGAYNEALVIIRAVNDRRCTLFGEHSDTLVSKSRWGRDANGKFDEAEKVFRKSLPVEERLYGADHRNTLTAKHNWRLYLASKTKSTKLLQVSLSLAVT